MDEDEIMVSYFNETWFRQEPFSMQALEASGAVTLMKIDFILHDIIWGYRSFLYQLAESSIHTALRRTN